MLRDDHSNADLPGSATVEVLLATYNGARFLREQIDSILQQSYPHLRILARDDGSTDGTTRILSEYANLYPDTFRVLPADSGRHGAKWNFMYLMQACTSPYVALADQDDVWCADKLESSMAAMRDLQKNFGVETPLLVFTDLEVVSQNLQQLNRSFWANQNIDPYRIAKLPRLLAQNVLTGCTALMNRPLVLRSLSMPEEAFMHDWWIALIASVYGHAKVLPQAAVRYRQHDANVVGAAEHFAPKLIPKWRYHTLRQAHWDMCVAQARGLLRTCGLDMPEKQRAVVEGMVQVEATPTRVLRAFRFLRGGFFQKGLRPNLATLWYLWDRDAARRQTTSTKLQDRA